MTKFQRKISESQGYTRSAVTPVRFYQSEFKEQLYAGYTLAFLKDKSG